MPESANVSQLHQQAARAFASRFGAPPRWCAAAPGRVNLIGEHTDYNQGHVLPIAIERWCLIVAGPSNSDQSTVVSAAQDDVLRVDLAPVVQRRESGWANYVLGTARQFQDRRGALPNINALIVSSVPVGSGLSSSAALCVAIATLLEQITGQSLEPRQKALLCQRVEHDFAGVPCGLMDQTASIMARAGHAIHLDCRDGSIEHVPMPDRERAVLLVVDTGVHHDLATNEYGLRRRQCEQAAAALAALSGRKIESLRDVDPSLLKQLGPRLDPVLLQRARHVVSENARVLQAIAALRSGDLKTLGELMYTSHESLRDDYAVSCRELDQIVESARAIGQDGGVFGARMTGGGFGGCAIVLCEPQAAQHCADRLSCALESASGRGATIFATSAASGASAVCESS